MAPIRVGSVEPAHDRVDGHRAGLIFCADDDLDVLTASSPGETITRETSQRLAKPKLLSMLGIQSVDQLHSDATRRCVRYRFRRLSQ